MINNQKYKINTMAKDLNMKSKDLLDLFTSLGMTNRKYSSVVENEEFNLVLEAITSKKQIANFDDYMNGKATIERKKDEPAKAETVIVNSSKPDTKEIKNMPKPSVGEKKQAESSVKKQASPVASNGKSTPQEKPSSEDVSDTKPPISEKRNENIPAQNKPISEDKNSAEKKNIQKTGVEEQIPAHKNADKRPISKAASRFEKKPEFGQQKDKKNKEREARKPARPQQPQKPAFQIGSRAEQNGSVIVSGSDSRVGKTRIVDTRTNDVDLSKYDEKLETFIATDSKRNDFAPERQKLKKQNNQRSQYQGKNDKEKRAMERMKQLELEKARKQQLVVSIPDEIAVGELAVRLKVTASEVIKKLMLLGVMANVNQIVDYDTAYLVADELGAKVNHEVTVTIEEKLFDETEDSEDNLLPRAPVVVVMGHVDHGKTSILDAIRHANVTAGEAGGITQHIGAYRVNIDGQPITFLDTPGHEAFTAMRARGAKATDIAILVVAADDGIMPQTVEAINHAKAAGLDIIVAINKMDKQGANPDNIKQELTKYDLVPEEWGGDVICVPVSALQKKGIDNLLESVLIVAEMKDLKANPNRRAKGIVIEAKLDKGRGPVATVLVQNGTLHNGDTIIAGTAVGRVRAMKDDKGANVVEAGPSVPVEIIGLSDVPTSGDEFNAVEDERMARELADKRRQKLRDEEFSANAKVSLDDLFAQISDGAKELKIIVKADVVGSAEAVKSSLEKLSNNEVKVKIIHSAVGGITEGDVMLASASNAIVVGFNVRPDKNALDTAERQKVDIRTYRIIYQCIEEITAAMKGMLAPVFKEALLGHAEVRQTIRVPNVGTIAGCYILDGKVTRKGLVRVLRDSVVIFEDKIGSLRRFKDDVKEVAEGYECGIGLEKFNDIKEGDVLEVYEMVEQKI